MVPDSLGRWSKSRLCVPPVTFCSAGASFAPVTVAVTVWVALFPWLSVMATS